MSRCTDRPTGDLLHAYELGILEEEDRLRFEAHLLTCQHCFERASKHLEAIGTLKSDPDIEAVARQVLKEAGKQRVRRPSLLKWLFARPIVRYAVVTAALLAVAIPVIRYSVSPPGPDQEIYLSPVRGGDNPVVDLTTGGLVAIAFVVPGTSPRSACAVVVTSRSGDTVYVDQDVADFSDAEQATILLQAGQLEPGVYTVAIANCRPAADDPARTYYFIAR